MILSFIFSSFHGNLFFNSHVLFAYNNHLFAHSHMISSTPIYYKKLINSYGFQTDLFDIQIEPQQILLLWVRESLGVIAMKK